MAKLNLFRRGYEASRVEKERQDKARENNGKKLWRFFLSADPKGGTNEADLRFLTEAPVNFYEHTVKKGDTYDSVVCSGDGCPFCKDGDRPTFKGAFLVVDRRPFEYTDKEGKKKTGKDQVRLFVQGMKVVSQLDRISNRYGLSCREVTIVRLGKGTQTTYTIEKGDKSVLTRKEIENLLPEKLRDSYNGTQESLMDIVEEQLTLLAPTTDEEEDEEEVVTSTSDRLISMDDDDEPPFDTDKVKAKKPAKKLFRKAQSSRKPLTKNLVRGKK